MPPSTKPLQTLHSIIPVIKHRPVINSSNLSRLGSSWNGRQPAEHAVNRKDELDVQSEAARSGQRERDGEAAPGSSAIAEKDPGKQNKKAERDHPEAPGPVIGMNDERGGVREGYTREE